MNVATDDARSGSMLNLPVADIICACLAGCNFCPARDPLPMARSPLDQISRPLSTHHMRFVALRTDAIVN